MNFLAKFFIIFVILNTVSLKSIPNSLKVCNQNGGDLNSCIKNSLRNLQRYLSTGDLGNGIRFTPLNVINMDEDIHYQYDDITVEVTNIKITGADQFTIEQVESSLNPFEVQIVLVYNNLKTTSDYRINAPNQYFSGSGKIEQSIDMLKQQFKFTFQKSYTGQMKVQNLKVNILDVRSGKTKFTPQGNSDRAFMEIVGEYVDENGDDIINEIKPVSERSSEKFYTAFANQILSHFSYDDLLPL